MESIIYTPVSTCDTRKGAKIKFRVQFRKIKYFLIGPKISKKFDKNTIHESYNKHRMTILYFLTIAAYSSYLQDQSYGASKFRYFFGYFPAFLLDFLEFSNCFNSGLLFKCQVFTIFPHKIELPADDALLNTAVFVREFIEYRDTSNGTLRAELQHIIDFVVTS